LFFYYFFNFLSLFVCLIFYCSMTSFYEFKKCTEKGRKTLVHLSPEKNGSYQKKKHLKQKLLTYWLVVLRGHSLTLGYHWAAVHGTDLQCNNIPRCGVGSRPACAKYHAIEYSRSIGKNQWREEVRRAAHRGRRRAVGTEGLAANCGNNRGDKKCHWLPKEKAKLELRVKLCSFNVKSTCWPPNAVSQSAVQNFFLSPRPFCFRQGKRAIKVRERP